MKLNIAICDDDNTMTSFLSSTILQYQVANNTDFQVDIFQNGKLIRTVSKARGLSCSFVRYRNACAKWHSSSECYKKYA